MFSFILFSTPSTTLIAKTAQSVGKIRNIIETRQGIITIYEQKDGDDFVYGGNVYDGRLNLDPIKNSNNIERLLILAALQDKPKNILVIGLSIGTWLKLLTCFPYAEKIDVVEINPGYLKAINEYPAQKSALKDPRVHVYIDDGRKWLLTHPQNQYDLIVMNTTFHWRAYATNLLSKDFLTIIRKHMSKHAILAYNTTGSVDAFKTAYQVYPFAFLYKNFVIAADFDWRNKLKTPLARQKLADLMLDGQPIFPKNNHQQQISSFLNYPIRSIEDIQKASNTQPVEVITDNNLLPEYRHAYYNF